jgi:hypothetical protein
MRVANVIQMEIFFPIGPLFGQRLGAEAGLHPCDPAVGQFARGGHILLVLVASDGSGTETAIVYGPVQGFPAARLHPSSYEIPHSQW